MEKIIIPCFIKTCETCAHWIDDSNEIIHSQHSHKCEKHKEKQTLFIGQQIKFYTHPPADFGCILHEDKR